MGPGLQAEAAWEGVGRLLGSASSRAGPVHSLANQRHNFTSDKGHLHTSLFNTILLMDSPLGVEEMDAKMELSIFLKWET